jgi:hypothetical protein
LSSKFGLGALGDIRCTQRADDPDALDPLCNQPSDADDLVKDQLRELLPELLTRRFLIGFVKSIDASDAGEVGDGFEVPDDS